MQEILISVQLYVNRWFSMILAAEEQGIGMVYSDSNILLQGTIWQQR